MSPIPQFLAHLVRFTEEILNGKLHFLCGGVYKETASFLHSSFENSCSVPFRSHERHFGFNQDNYFEHTLPGKIKQSTEKTCSKN